MIRIRYKCEGFAPHLGTLLQGSKHLDIEWNDLVWAAISVGKLGYSDLMGHGRFSLDEARFRAYLIYSHLMQEGTRICKSPLYESLDSTEKGAASYFIGMTISKIVGASLLGIPWLVHLEKLRALYNIDLRGKSRPDLLGLNPKGKWNVFEAKGRSKGFSQYALDKAKDQTGQIRSISGVSPALYVATESFFDPYLKVRIADPEELDDDAIDVKVDQNQFLLAYYSTFRSLMQFSGSVDIEHDQRYSFAEDESAGISIGIDRRLLSSLEQGEIKRGDLGDVTWNTKVSRQDKRSIKYYPDGIAISLDDRLWSDEIMSLNPSKRRL